MLGEEALRVPRQGLKRVPVNGHPLKSPFAARGVLSYDPRAWVPYLENAFWPEWARRESYRRAATAKCHQITARTPNPHKSEYKSADLSECRAC